MTNPDRSLNPDRFRLNAGLVHDGEVAPSPAGPGFSKRYLQALRQPKRKDEQDTHSSSSDCSSDGGPSRQ